MGEGGGSREERWRSRVEAREGKGKKVERKGKEGEKNVEKEMRVV